MSICNEKAAVCADTGATHSVAGKNLYKLLQQHRVKFQDKSMEMTLAGHIQSTEVLTATFDTTFQRKVIPTEFIVLKHAGGNRTLLNVDFLTAAGIILNLQRKQ